MKKFDPRHSLANPANYMRIPYFEPEKKYPGGLGLTGALVDEI
jgi:hypothetical protein